MACRKGLSTPENGDAHIVDTDAGVRKRTWIGRSQDSRSCNWLAIVADTSDPRCLAILNYSSSVREGALLLPGAGPYVVVVVDKYTSAVLGKFNADGVIDCITHLANDPQPGRLGFLSACDPALAKRIETTVMMAQTPAGHA